MKRMRNYLRQVLTAALSAVLLGGCSSPRQAEPELPEEQVMQEQTVGTWMQSYTVSTAEISEGREAVLFQEECRGGFLAYINRKVREEIPPELKQDPDFTNDGHYDVYESSLFRVTESGKRDQVRYFKPMAAPENTEKLEEFFSECRPRAFREREDGSIVVLESSYEAWLSHGGTQTRDRYFVRLIKENGVGISRAEIETVQGSGLNCAQAVLLGMNQIAVPQGAEVLFFGLDGKKQFSVSTPFPILELCKTRDGRLAVILSDQGSLWVSVVDASDRTATVPLQMPEGTHSFCAGRDKDELLCLRNTEIYSYDLRNGESGKLISLLSLGINPSEVGAFFAEDDGRLHFLLYARKEAGDAVAECYLTASPCEIPTERVLLHIGFEAASDDLTEALLRFNRENRAAFLESVDYRNEDTELSAESIPELVVMDEELYEHLLSTGGLADLGGMLEQDRDFDSEDLFPSVFKALSDENGALRRLSAGFRIESMACDGATAEGKTSLSISDLRGLLAAMPADSLLYEPYYTSARLLEDLCKVNASALGSGDSLDTALYAELLNYSNLQPASYSYNDYMTDSSSMESRIYSGRLLLLQAHIATLDDLKWYDAFFENGASFVGWPMEEGSRSRICFDECVGISADCSEEQTAAAWQFVRMLLEDDYLKAYQGFPVLQEELTKQMEADMAAVSYRLDEKGKFETDKKGNKIEIARDTWYSPEWRRHFVYALTEMQQQKLLTLIENSI